MGHFLYNIFIMPLEMLFQCIFSLSNSVFLNLGISIIAISIVMNIMVLPLYKRADAVQEEERKKQKDMEFWVKHIRKTFRGDERFMMLSTYYRQQNYHPLYAVKSSLSLLLQIPFFIAAYHFLSNLSALDGEAFWILGNLGKPDALLTIGAVSINILPILMTVINFASGAIYTKGFPVRDKVQLYGVALIFLVLLYRSPSGLVFYWTLNNLFSLGKNVLYKVIPEPEKVLRWTVAILAIALAAFVFYDNLAVSVGSKVFFISFAIVCAVPLVWPWISKHVKKRITIPEMKFVSDAQYTKIFFLCAIIMMLLCGAYIPSNVIAVSPAEFLSADSSGIYLILNNLSIYSGVFLWVAIFFVLAENKTRVIFTWIIWLISGASIVNFLFFGNDYGLISNLLIYDNTPSWSISGNCANLAALCGALCILILILMKFPRTIRIICPVIIAGILCVSVINCGIIISETEDARELLAVNEASEAENIIPLSKEGNNVVVIMLDRAISAYVPYIFNEKSELYEQYEGFTYYPNTLAYGMHTNFTTPSLFGGYEYTPEEINRRTDKLLKDEQNEALSVMPKLFSDNGYEVTVCDPPYAGYSWISDLSIFDKIDNVNAFNTISEKNAKKYTPEFFEFQESNIDNNCFFYSIFRIVPTFLEHVFYDDGNYLFPEKVADKNYMISYSALISLQAITRINDGSKNTFLMLQNDTTHNPALLSVPDYSNLILIKNPRSYYVKNNLLDLNGRHLSIDTDQQLYHYQVNVSSLMALGRWLDFLKENDVYDNTRIIIVSDHGTDLSQFDDLLLSNGIDLERFNSLLLFKDFDKSGRLVTSDEFMTTADVPTLATGTVIENPVNPFTGKLINSDSKINPQRITTSALFDVDTNNGYKFDTSDGKWYAVKDDIFDVRNWTLLED